MAISARVRKLAVEASLFDAGARWRYFDFFFFLGAVHVSVVSPHFEIVPKLPHSGHQ